VQEAKRTFLSLFPISIAAAFIHPPEYILPKVSKIPDKTLKIVYKSINFMQ
jgi:hypothetical protein